MLQFLLLSIPEMPDLQHIALVRRSGTFRRWVPTVGRWGYALVGVGDDDILPFHLSL